MHTAATLPLAPQALCTTQLPRLWPERALVQRVPVVPSPQRDRTVSPFRAVWARAGTCGHCCHGTADACFFPGWREAGVSGMSQVCTFPWGTSPPQNPPPVLLLSGQEACKMGGSGFGKPACPKAGAESCARRTAVAPAAGGAASVRRALPPGLTGKARWVLSLLFRHLLPEPPPPLCARQLLPPTCCQSASSCLSASPGLPTHPPPPEGSPGLSWAKQPLVL